MQGGEQPGEGAAEGPGPVALPTPSPPSSGRPGFPLGHGPSLGPSLPRLLPLHTQATRPSYLIGPSLHPLLGDSPSEVSVCAMPGTPALEPLPTPPSHPAPDTPNSASQTCPSSAPHSPSPPSGGQSRAFGEYLRPLSKSSARPTLCLRPPAPGALVPGAAAHCPTPLMAEGAAASDSEPSSPSPSTPATGSGWLAPPRLHLDTTSRKPSVKAQMRL